MKLDYYRFIVARNGIYLLKLDVHSCWLSDTFAENVYTLLKMLKFDVIFAENVYNLLKILKSDVIFAKNVYSLLKMLKSNVIVAENHILTELDVHSCWKSDLVAENAYNLLKM